MKTNIFGISDFLVMTKSRPQEKNISSPIGKKKERKKMFTGENAYKLSDFQIIQPKLTTVEEKHCVKNFKCMRVNVHT